MSASMFVPEPTAPPTLVAPGTYPIHSRQLPVAREMIASLDTLTPAGRRHMMGKIVALLDAIVIQDVCAGSGRNRHALADLVERLSWESERVWPDVPGFSRRAETLVDLLAAIA